MRAYSLQEAKENSTKVTSLFLQEKDIADLFFWMEKMPELEALHINYCQLEELPKIIKWPAGLEVIDFSFNHLKRLECNLPFSLKELLIRDNDLDEIPYRLRECPRLTLVNFQQNNLRECDLSPHQHLRSINLSHNTIVELTVPPEELRYLDISYNKIKRIPLSVARSQHLDYLNAAHNQIELLHKQIGLWPELSTLLLSHNKIKRLPKQLFHLTYLRQLDLNNNQVISIPKYIGQLKWLSELTFSHNHVKKLPLAISECRQLQKLEMQHNAIRSLPRKIHQLERLYILNCKNNQLRRLPLLPFALKELNCALNQIDAFPTRLARLRMLKKLDLSGNDIEQFPKSAEQLFHLEVLTLNNMPRQFRVGSILRLNSLDEIQSHAITEEDRQYLLEIFQVSVRQALNYAKKQQLWKLRRAENSSIDTSRNFLLDILPESPPTLKFNIRRYMLNQEGFEGKKVGILGTPHFNYEEFRLRASWQNIQLIDEPSTSQKALILGKPPYPKEFKLNRKQQLISERFFLNFLIKKEQTKSKSSNPELLSRMLDSKDEANKKLALNLLWARGLEENEWENLYQHWETETNLSLRIAMRKALLSFGTEIQRRRLY